MLQVRTQKRFLARKKNNFEIQSRREEDIIQIEQMYSEQISKYRLESDEQIQKLQLRIQELEEWNKNHQG